MRYLLDTQVLLWALTDSARLPEAARRILEEGEVVVSVASVWEVTIKNGLGRPEFRVNPSEFLAACRRAGFDVLDIHADHAVRVGDLEALHSDPFDRLLLAQARCEGLILVTADRRITQYGDDLVLPVGRAARR